VKTRLLAKQDAQSGYILLALLMFVTLLIIGLGAVVPRISHQIRRQREEELIERGTQYVRAIRKFYRRFGRYPTSLDELEKTNNIRFLRRRYKDPITGQDFRLIHYGEAKSIPGLPSQPTPGKPIGTPVSQTSRPIGMGPRFGGGPIIGVGSTAEKESIKEWNKKTRYNEWEFVYDPRLDAGGQAIGVPPGTIPGQQRGPGLPTLPPPGTPSPGPQQPSPQVPR
jgi:type II secretory pathway pseudopilin PulG